MKQTSMSKYINRLKKKKLRNSILIIVQRSFIIVDCIGGGGKVKELSCSLFISSVVNFGIKGTFSNPLSSAARVVFLVIILPVFDLSFGTGMK